ncbi:MAG: hypothetical protein ABIZ04_20910 [Opitutus sp.]
MTAAQQAKYFAEYGKLRDVLRARGWSSTKIELHRAEITVKALGRHKSSKAFTNADLDKVLAVIKAETAPADFDAQMRLQDMPEKRRAILMARIHSLSLCVGLNPGGESGYVQAIAKNMFGTSQYDDLSEQQLGVIEGVLRRRLKQQHLTLEQIHEREREAAEYAAKIVGIVTPEIVRQRALVAGEDF